MHLDIEHDIKFIYSDYISESWVELRIEPQTSTSQTVSQFFLAVGPRAKVLRYLDWCGNAVRHFSVAEYHNMIEVRARSIVETKTVRTFLQSLPEPVAPMEKLGPLIDYLSFDGPIRDSKVLRDELKSVGIEPSMSLGEKVERIGKYVHNEFKYMPNVTTYKSTIDEALDHRSGVCQDLAQIMIGLLRLEGIPARYVNGYLYVSKAGNETCESHAWIEFYSQAEGWVGYDPTGCIQPSEHHVVVATARHYDEVPPNRGVYRGAAQETLNAAVRIKAIEAPEFSSFREEIREIELPVYSEFPGRKKVGTPEDQADQTNQQQQQQQ